MPVKRRCAQCKQFKESTYLRVVTCGDLCGCEQDEWLCHPCAKRAEKTGAGE
jgi:hypothetical protein